MSCGVRNHDGYMCLDCRHDCIILCTHILLLLSSINSSSMELNRRKSFSDQGSGIMTDASYSFSHNNRV